MPGDSGQSLPPIQAAAGAAGNLSTASTPTVGAVEPGWQREHKRWLAWDPGRSLLASIRTYQRHMGRRGVLGYLPRAAAVVRHRFWSAVTGADIPVNCQIGGGLLIPHPNGIVIHPRAQIGPNCLLFQQVTLGTVRDGGVPQLGAWVDVGAGAKVLGPVRIGDHAAIGANAVVLHDVPALHLAVGMPAVARPLRSSRDDAGQAHR